MVADDCCLSASTCGVVNECEFTSDVWLAAYFERAGRSAQAFMAKPYLRHHLSSIHIELDLPGEARSTGYFLAITDTGPDHWGRYRDALRHDGTSWRIQHRRLQLEGRAPGGWLDKHENARGTEHQS